MTISPNEILFGVYDAGSGNTSVVNITN